jgi:putative DNA methylase
MTYHHTRTEGWAALYRAIRTAGFVVTKTHPVKAEMAVAVPVQQAKVPVSFDLIMVCRESPGEPGDQPAAGDLLQLAADEARAVVSALRAGGLSLTSGDVKVALMGCILVRLSALPSAASATAFLEQHEPLIDTLAQHLV